VLHQSEFPVHDLHKWPTGLPDFSYCNIPKREKCTKWQTNITNGNKI
jgi:hypothetical protein